MSTVSTTQTTGAVHAVSDVLVNRRRGRFDLALAPDALLLRQGDSEERIELIDIDGVDASTTERRVRVRFRTVDGSAWTIRWFDAPTSRTALILDAFRSR